MKINIKRLAEEVPNFAAYVFILKSLVNFRVIEGDDEATTKGKSVISKLISKYENAINERLIKGESTDEVLSSLNKSYEGRALKLLAKVSPEQKLKDYFGASWEDCPENATVIFWEEVRKEVCNMLKIK